MKHLLFICLLLYSTSSFSQITFQKVYGDSLESPRCITQTSDGGYIVSGYTESYNPGNTDLYIIKTDSLGDTLWTKTYGSQSGPVWGGYIRQTSDGGYIIYAPTNGSCLLRIDSIGSILWTKTFSNLYSSNRSSVQQTSDQGFIVAGSSGGDACLIKTDLAGDTMWVKKYGGNGITAETADVVQQTEDGGYIFCGGTGSFGAGGLDAYLVKTDSIGDTLWTKAYGSVDDENAFYVQLTDDGGYIFTGYARDSLSNTDIYLVKTNGTGDTLWTKTYSGNGLEEGKYVQQTSDGGYAVFGHMGGSPCLLKVDSVGNIVWKTLYYSNFGDGYSAQQTNDSGYVLTGNTYEPVTGNYKYYIIKTNSEGKSGCNEYWSTVGFLSPTATQVSNTLTVVSSASINLSITVSEIGHGGTVDVLCMSTGINDHEPAQKGITLFPNPAMDELTIALSPTYRTSSGKTSLIICNLSGEKIIEKEIISAETKIDLTTFNAGVYVVMVRNEHFSSVEKVVVVK